MNIYQISKTLKQVQGDGERYRFGFLPQQKIDVGQAVPDKRGFTLAEVLITLVVIGIIAAITVPVIQTNIRKKATLTQLKKGYSMLGQLVKRSELDNGPVKTWQFPAEDYEGVNTDFYKTYFEPYLNKLKDSERVYYRILNIDGTEASGIQFNTWDVLADGTTLTVFTHGGDYAYCWLFYDVNGLNPPNRLGKDIFMFEMYHNYPVQRESTSYKLNFVGYQYGTDSLITGQHTCKKGTGQKYAGGFCGAWIQKNNWEFPDGYPW